MSNIIEDITNTLSGNDNISSVEYDAIMTALNVIKDKLDKYIPIIESNVIRLNLLNENIQSLNTTVIDTNLTYKTLSDAINEIQTKVDNKLDEIDDKLVVLDNNKFNLLEQKINANVSSIRDINNTFNSYKTTNDRNLQTLNGNFSLLRKEIDDNAQSCNDNFELCMEKIYDNKSSITAADTNSTEAYKLANEAQLISTIMRRTIEQVHAPEIAKNKQDIATINNILATFSPSGDVDLSGITQQISEASLKAENAMNKANSNKNEIDNINTSVSSHIGAISDLTSKVNTNITNITNLTERVNNIHVSEGGDIVPGIEAILPERLNINTCKYQIDVDKNMYFYNEKYDSDEYKGKFIFVESILCNIVYFVPRDLDNSNGRYIIKPVNHIININMFDKTTTDRTETIINENTFTYDFSNNIFDLREIGTFVTSVPPVVGDIIYITYRDNRLTCLVNNMLPASNDTDENSKLYQYRMKVLLHDYSNDYNSASVVKLESLI